MAQNKRNIPKYVAAWISAKALEMWSLSLRIQPKSLSVSQGCYSHVALWKAGLGRKLDPNRIFSHLTS